MDYKALMGYGKKKKKVIKEEPKPKKNKIIESVKEEFGLVKEVGAGYDYHKVTKQIEMSYKKYWDNVKNLEKLMMKKGQQKQAKIIHKEYSKKVLGFHSWLRGMIDKLL
tara:strand:- start:714 stop:1040 length:327 start_codon:yes stop_codon:yes gene_type:complete